jgi:hypothetical protein
MRRDKSARRGPRGGTVPPATIRTKTWLKSVWHDRMLASRRLNEVDYRDPDPPCASLSGDSRLGRWRHCTPVDFSLGIDGVDRDRACVRDCYHGVYNEPSVPKLSDSHYGCPVERSQPADSQSLRQVWVSAITWNELIPDPGLCLRNASSPPGQHDHQSSGGCPGHRSHGVTAGPTSSTSAPVPRSVPSPRTVSAASPLAALPPAAARRTIPARP